MIQKPKLPGTMHLPVTFRFDRYSPELKLIRDALYQEMHVHVAYADGGAAGNAQRVFIVSFSDAPYKEARANAIRDCCPNFAVLEHEPIGQMCTATTGSKLMAESLDAGYSFHLIAETDECLDRYTLVCVLPDNS